MTMMLYDMGWQYHAERVMSAGEQLRADEQADRRAAEAAWAWQRYLSHPARALRALWMTGVTIGA